MFLRRNTDNRHNSRCLLRNQGLRVTRMGLVGHQSRSNGCVPDFFEESESSQFFTSCTVVSDITVQNIVIFSLILWLNGELMQKVIDPWRVSLLHDDLGDIFVLESLLGEHGDKEDSDLAWMMSTRDSSLSLGYGRMFFRSSSINFLKCCLSLS